LLPSLKVEQTRPELQSLSLEQESHSPPDEWQLLAGRASSTITASSTHRVRVIEAPPSRSKL
jgi:hypothetical protein